MSLTLHFHVCVCLCLYLCLCGCFASVLCGSLLLGDREAGRHETKEYLHYVNFLTSVRLAVGMDQTTEVAVVRNKITTQNKISDILLDASWLAEE